MIIKNGFLSFMFNKKIIKLFQNPVFIVACGRSGSTAICRALNTHPNVFVAPREAPVIHKMGELIYEQYLGNHTHYYLTSSLLSNKQFNYLIKNLILQNTFGKNYGVNYNPLKRKRVNSVFKKNTSQTWWGAKAFPNEHSAEGLEILFPKVKFIYLYRNGIDSVQSMTRFGTFKKNSFTENCIFWNKRAIQYNYLRNRENALSVSFEAFLANNKSIFGDICKHLEIPYDPAPEIFASTKHIHPHDSKTGINNPARELSKRPAPHENWTKEQKSVFKDICSEGMQLLNYEIPF